MCLLINALLRLLGLKPTECNTETRGEVAEYLIFLWPIRLP